MYSKRLEANEKNVETLTRLDLVIRAKGIKNIFVVSDYFDEGAFEITQELASLMQSFYSRKCALLDLGDEESRVISPIVDYHNARKLGLDESMENSYSNSLEETLSLLEAENDLVFVIHNTKRNPQSTKLPRVEFQSSLIVRSKKSSEIGKSRYVTNLLKDANLPILGMIYNRV